MKSRDNEQWMDVREFEGSYQVSDRGRVKSLPHKGSPSKVELIMKLHEDNGYLSVWLRKPGVNKKIRLHRLVALHFLPLPPNPAELVVNHKDRDRHNNTVANLEWATYSENTQHYVEDDKVKAGNQKIEYATAADIPF